LENRFSKTVGQRRRLEEKGAESLAPVCSGQDKKEHRSGLRSLRAISGSGSWV
jgi:hypothetical protein